MQKNKRLWWTLGVAGLLFAYLLCRFALFGLHGMKQWPNTLATVGVVVLAIAYLIDFRKLAITVAAGYMGGFIIAMIFNSSGSDGETGNAWLIWAVVYFAAIAAGVVWELVGRHCRKK